MGGLFSSVCLAGNNKQFPRGLEDCGLLLFCRPFSWHTSPCFLSSLENHTFMNLCSKKEEKTSITACCKLVSLVWLTKPTKSIVLSVLAGVLL